MPGSGPASPPNAPRRPHVWRRPTGGVEDPWAWMRDVDDPEFLRLVEQENRYSSAWLAPRAGLVDTIYDEIRSRVQETDQGVPVRFGDWWYVSSTVEGRSYPVHRRGRTAESATDRLVLDENVESEGHPYFHLGALDPSPDHRLVAWSADTSGDERYVLNIRDLDTDVDAHGVAHGVSNAGVAWSRDSRHLFYVRPDAQERPFEVWRHTVGSDGRTADVLVHREDDERFYVSIGSSRSQRWILIHSASATTAEAFAIDADDASSPPRSIAPRRPGIEYSVDDWGDRFVMLTNDGADDFRLLASADPFADDASWEEIEPGVPGRRLTSVEAFADHLVVHEWSDAQPRIRVVGRDLSDRPVDTGHEPLDVEPGANPEWSTDVVRYRTAALAAPTTEWQERLDGTERHLLKRTPTPGVDPALYVSERHWATGHDGALVPLDVVRHRDTPLDGSAPGLLYGYGAYEVSIPPWFSVGRISLLDRGWVWALAHPRGGGELGRRWYLDGKMELKQNTFADFESCANHLIDTGHVHPERLAIRGGSAGGLLVGACTVRAPDAYAAVVAEVPFVDIVSTMLDDTLPLTAIEREEWGDPREPEACARMESYSPYDNTVPADYPAMYVTAGLNDPRVGAHEPVKWVSRLRSVVTGSEPILLRVETGAGHGGPSGRYDAWRDEARLLAFLIETV